MDTVVQGVGLVIIAVGVAIVTVSVVRFARLYFGDSSNDDDDRGVRRHSA